MTGFAGRRDDVSARPRFADPAVQAEVSLFLAHETSLLDNRCFHAWVEIVDEQFTYQVPTPITPDSPFKPHYDDRSLLIDESKWSMTTQWFRRFDEDIYEMSWGENPPVRFRHFLTNIRVLQTDDPDEYIAHSNVMLVGTRQSDPPKFVSGERTDTIARRDAGLVLLKRWVVLDQSVIDFPQLRILL
ncbi:MAG: aromatic-ring-hydroxylating dioxygenase subunit beta [Jatrophihabitantaceae bacterium]